MGNWWAKRSMDDLNENDSQYFVGGKKGPQSNKSYLYSSLTQFLAKKGTGYTFKDTIVISTSKSRISFNFFFPVVINNSPVNYKDEVFILLHEAAKLRTTPIEHFNSILTEKSPYEYEYKFINFELMGEDHQPWCEQITNDLENLFINENLQLIGGYASKNHFNQFTYVMYKLSEQAKKDNLFDLVIKSVYGPLQQKEFESYLNDEYTKNSLMYRWVFTIYRIDKESVLSGKATVFMNLIVFQKMTVNYEHYNESMKFQVISIPAFSKKLDPEVTLLGKSYLEYSKFYSNAKNFGTHINNYLFEFSLILI